MKIKFSNVIHCWKMHSKWANQTIEKFLVNKTPYFNKYHFHSRRMCRRFSLVVELILYTYMRHGSSIANLLPKMSEKRE